MAVTSPDQALDALDALAALAGLSDPTNVRILDAAYAEFTAGGVRRTTMNQVANAAGLGVATVYRRFPQKAKLLEAVLVREALAVTVAVATELEHAGSRVEEQAAGGFTAFAHAIADRPLLVRLLRGDADHDGHAVAPGDLFDRILAIATDYVSGWVTRLQEHGRYRSVDARVVAEIQTRLALSLILVPDGAIPMTDDAATRAFAQKYLVPLLGPE